VRNENGRLCALVTQTQLVLAPRAASPDEATSSR